MIRELWLEFEIGERNLLPTFIRKFMSAFLNAGAKPAVFERFDVNKLRKHKLLEVTLGHTSHSDEYAEMVEE